MTCMLIAIAILEEFDESGDITYLDDPNMEPEFVAPSLLVVRRPDGGPITVGDVVAQVDPYLKANRADIIKFKDQILGDGETAGDKTYFGQLASHGNASDYVSGEDDQPSDEPRLYFSLELFRPSDTYPEDEHWKLVETQIRLWESKQGWLP